MTSKMLKFIHTYTCLSSATRKMSLVFKDFFGLTSINRSRGMKYQFLKKIYDVVNKVYAFKFENLSFHRVSIAVNGNGNQIPRFSI